MLRDAEDLRGTLRRIDGRGYKAYKDLRGSYALGDGLTLFVDHVQGDPFAAPSKLRLRMDRDASGVPESLSEGRVRRIALQDFLAREARRAIGRDGGTRRGSGRSGAISVDAGGQEVLERTAARVGSGFLELRLQAGLPAAGRRVLGREAEALLLDDLPRVAARALTWQELPQEEAVAFVDGVENQEHLRAQLPERGLVAFVADGAVLPRESGSSDRPLQGPGVVPFRSPDSLRVELALAHPVETPGGPRSRIAGMGLPRGVTLIVGGGYHGKSTLLHALERCVYPHVPGDGRELVVSDAALVKIRAEDGRRVEQVDISAFIDRLPQGRSTTAFQSEDASGSTSQAANIVEAVEAGATGLLLDEDTSATNFMIRDGRMQALVHREHEPITPFLERVRELYDVHGVSTVLVMGGCGDYFDVADTVIATREFLPEECTDQARAIAARTPTGRRPEASAPFAAVAPRVPEPGSFDPSRGRREVKIDARALDQVGFGSETIDLRGVEQLVDLSQTRAVGHALHLASTRFMDGRATLREVLERVEALFDAEGLDALDPFHRGGHHPGNFARPRALEVAAAVNRLRSLRMRRRGREER